jgi:hypothetical protein
MDPKPSSNDIHLEEKTLPRDSPCESTKGELKANSRLKPSRQIVLNVRSREEDTDCQESSEKRLRLQTKLPQVGLCGAFARRPPNLRALDLSHDLSVAEHPSVFRVFSPTHPEAPPPPRASSVARCPFSPTHPEVTFPDAQKFPFSPTHPEASALSTLRISSDDI